MIVVELPKVIDLNSNFQSITIKSETFGEVRASNVTGSFEIQAEGESLHLNFEDDIPELEIVLKA